MTCLRKKRIGKHRANAYTTIDNLQKLFADGLNGLPGVGSYAATATQPIELDNSSQWRNVQRRRHDPTGQGWTVG